MHLVYINNHVDFTLKLHKADTTVKFRVECFKCIGRSFLSVSIIRTVRRDIAHYNRDEEMDETLDETGWKLVHGDVFRPPPHQMILVNLVGTGLQLLGMVSVTVFMLYSAFYFHTKLSIVGFVPTVLYFAYSALIAITFWFLTGTIGFYAAYAFLCRIYAALKID